MKLAAITTTLILLASPTFAGGMAPPIEGYVPTPPPAKVAPAPRIQGDCSDVFYKDCHERPDPKQPRPKPQPPQPEPEKPVKEKEPPHDPCACGGGFVREDVA